MRLARTQTHGRPTDSSARFQTAAPGRRSADWKFHHDRHQPKAGAATPRRSSPSPPRPPGDQTPTNSTSHRGPNSSPAASSMHAEGAPQDRTYAPRPGCAAGVQGVRRGRAGGEQNPRPSVCPGTRPRDHLRLAPRARPDPAPTHPSRAVAGRARTRASLLPPAPALTHLFASPCRRARRCRVPLCTLRYICVKAWRRIKELEKQETFLLIPRLRALPP